MTKYFSSLQIRESITALSEIHVFFGTTFLVLKRNEAPVGKTFHLSLDAENRAHLKRHFRLHPKSDFFFVPFQVKKNESHWRRPKYASTTLQAVNTQSFEPALIHPKNEPLWGWRDRYVEFLSGKLPRGRKISMLHLAVWIFRNDPFEDSVSTRTIIDRFIAYFRITSHELDVLFDVGGANDDPSPSVFNNLPPSWEDVIEGFGLPPDVPLDGGAILQYLEFSGLAPAKNLRLNAASRLNLITGDNGLGKTFLLDMVWWALTQEWPDQQIVPLATSASKPRVSYLVSNRPRGEPIISEFDVSGHRWKSQPRSAMSGLVVYARVDGSFAVWDPANPALTSTPSNDGRSSASFSRDDVWAGGDRIEGLLRDWVKWQTRRQEFPAFETFSRVVNRTKPPDLGDLTIGAPARVRGWVREIPTLVHPYGTVPVVYESAGIKRILSLAYLIVWAWEEHKIQAAAAGRKEEHQLVILIDEAEAHLHPRWQRVLLSALLGIQQDLHKELAIQFFIASHSPLVLASAESVWDPATDSLFHLKMAGDGSVTFNEVPFEIRGTVDAWLKSPSFDELYPGSREADDAVRRAKGLIDQAQPRKEDIEIISDELARHLAAEDPFWLRWAVFASKFGVDL